MQDGNGTRQIFRDESQRQLPPLASFTRMFAQRTDIIGLWTLHGVRPRYSMNSTEGHCVVHDLQYILQ